MKRLLLIPLSALLIVSCAGLKGNIGKVPPPVEEVTLDRINTLVDDGKYADAFQNLFWLSEGGSSGKELLKERIRNGFQAGYNKALKEDRYIDAYRILLSAKTADIGMNDGGQTLNSLIEKILFSGSDDYTPVSRLYIARKYMNFNSLDKDDLKKIADMAVTEGDKGFLEFLRPFLDEKGIVPDDTFNKVLESRYSSSQLIKGTVTIWVNRGMKIENGMGIPDRVIGSGFFIDNRGYILTNYHVISSEVDPEYEGYSRLYVKLSDNTKEKIPAKVVGWDRVFDVALLKVDTSPETVFRFGQEKQYEPGTPIIAIGSPGGLENTITSGIISAYGRKFLQLGTVMQVDAPINHGNSGGPLLDKENNLIGIVFAGIEQFEGINFVIPGRYVVRLLPDLYGGGKLQHPFLGVSLYEKDGEVSVTYVMPGSSAARAGIKKGMKITGFNGIKVTSVEELQKIMMKYAPGMIVKMELEKGDTPFEGYFALTQRPDKPAKEAYEIDATENLFLPLFGMEVDSVSTGLLGKDFIITSVLEGSIADESGLSVNDPFTVQRVKMDSENDMLYLEIRIKRRKSGFLESGLLLTTYLETGDFI